MSENIILFFGSRHSSLYEVDSLTGAHRLQILPLEDKVNRLDVILATQDLERNFVARRY